ncbi:hypothetical protein K470DRAFT_295278 [Piedraia hortae CBS 480.64]|uniref:Ams2/SPT21 N-terminal domain-containing protein n=1 Tax=Piedraia hortae CBS 480.64 TaxID=1314780 RepID=A0A6A7BXA3_9PEZI|nr:hypothetical protein K470DRAFT_295278 [Piedraia hortae CBS 480.64]
MDGYSDYGDLPTRLMRVKVLYSFDDNQNNCLARFPQPQQIPAVVIDETAQVGVIDLQQCIQAVLGASPELYPNAKTGDYTIYAYDYSEYGSPLVGQGTLSAALSSQADPTAEKTMITGRVCRNLPLLFNNNTKETLEVKLKLVPLPLQSSTSSFWGAGAIRSSSPATSAGFDPNAWSAFTQMSRPVIEHKENFGETSLSKEDLAIMDEVLGLGSNNASWTRQDVDGTAGTPFGSAIDMDDATAVASMPCSRSGSPMIGSDASWPALSATASNRPRSGSSLSESRVPVMSTAFENDGGPSRKRAKITQAHWRGRSSFAAHGELRVAAATAHSVQMQRPVATRPVAGRTRLEPPPRAPTPIPQQAPNFQRRQSRNASSGLVQQSSYLSVTSPVPSLSPGLEQPADSNMSSPDVIPTDMSHTAGSTPQYLPSSPPILAGTGVLEPTSPGLPALIPPDSGYRSESPLKSGVVTDDLCTYGGGDEMDPNSAISYFCDDGFTSCFNDDDDQTQTTIQVEMEMPGDMSQLPQEMRLDLGNTEPQFPASIQELENTNLNPNPPRLALPNPSRSSSHSGRLADREQQTQSQKPSELARKKRSRADAENSDCGSPAPSEADSIQCSRSCATRRADVIEQRLLQDITNGQMPQHCFHCGEIRTPTWRKLYIKIVEGKPTSLDEFEVEGETIGIKVLEKDPVSNEITRFMVYKSMKKTKNCSPGKGFIDKVVCNPCGLWFNKNRTMRPPEKWTRRPYARRRRRQNTDGPMTDDMEPSSEACWPTDQLVLEDSTASDVQTTLASRQRSNSIQLPPMSSDHNTRPGKAESALARDGDGTDERNQQTYIVI